jgi:hypothetical protein
VCVCVYMLTFVCVRKRAQSSAAFCAVAGLTTPVSHVLLLLLHDMFQSHKDHLQVCMPLHIYWYTVGTLVIYYVLNYFFIYLWIYSLCGHWLLFQFLDLYTVGRTPWMGDQPITWSLPTHRPTQTQNKRTQTSMPRMGFEPMIPVSEQAKTVHALDHMVTVISRFLL